MAVEELPFEMGLRKVAHKLAKDDQYWYIGKLPTAIGVLTDVSISGYSIKATWEGNTYTVVGTRNINTWQQWADEAVKHLKRKDGDQ